MIQRLWPHLVGEPEPSVIRSATGRSNLALQGAWASFYADRAMLSITVVWLGIRYFEWRRIILRPEGIYDQKMWLGQLVFPELSGSTVFYFLFIASLALTILCFVRPQSILWRVLLAISLLLVSVPGQGYGHIEHTGHLLLLAHIYSIFRPAGRPERGDSAVHRNRGYTWYLLGLLAVYTASGLWKVVDLTVRDVLKPGVNWLHPDAMLSTSIASMRGVDLGMTVPQIVDSIAWAFPIGYVVLTLIFAGSFIGAFRRPFLLIVVPTVVAFHILNAVVMYVLFIITIFVAVAVLTPYELFVPAIRRQLVPVAARNFSGRGGDALYEVRYVNGDADLFRGFYAYRERIRDRSALFAAPLYYPGLGLVSNKILEAIRTRASA